MDREDIIRMAREAGWDLEWAGTTVERGVRNLVAAAVAAEREECAKVADECWVFGMSSAYIADAIRARGGK